MKSGKKSISEYWQKILFRTILFLALIAFQQNTFAQLQIPVVDTISIDVNNHPIISWQPNNDLTLGYRILRWDPVDFWVEIDSAWGIEKSSYTDNSILANSVTRPLLYCLYAYNFDTFNNQSDWSDYLFTIYLLDPKLNICANNVPLRWTKYLNMPVSLGEYQILASTNGDAGPFVKIGTTFPSDTVFIHNNLAYNTKYTYMIRAVNNDGAKTSSSCKKSVTSYTPRQPNSICLRYATVRLNEKDVKLEWTAGNGAPISKFKILRSSDGSFYDTIFVNEDFSNYKPSTEFIDLDADFDVQSYYYQIRVCDSCGLDMLASDNIAKTIFLSGSPGSDGTTNELHWTPYEDWNFGGLNVQKYRIYRKVNGLPNPAELIDSVLANTTTYSNNVSNFGFSEGGSFNYYVEAVETSGNNGYESFKDISTSNEIEIIQETKVVVPNAFTPELATNNSFKPFTRFIDPTEYSFSIFNKWGQMIFETQDFTKGWDGKHKGEFVDSDSYVYLLLYRTPEGQNIEKRGTVTVVR